MWKFAFRRPEHPGPGRLTAATFAWLVTFGLGSLSLAGPMISGEARVVDGDTVVVSGEKIRLNGVDAPETDQVCLTKVGAAWSCGIEARDQLIAKTAGKTWNCAVSGHDRYGRSLATCEVGGEDIDRWMVQQGWALSFVRYSHQYDRDEEQARTSLKGLWAGAFIAPWDWRARNVDTVVLGAFSVPVGAQKTLIAPVNEQAQPVGACQIKGNVNRQGACIFHVPGGRYYAKTRIDVSKGERWFCTREEAEAAGCRGSAQ